MYNIRLSSYTLNELDVLLLTNSVIKRIGNIYARVNIYNLAQESIAKLYKESSKIILLPPTLVENDKLLFEASEDQNTYIYTLRPKDIENIRGSLFPLSTIDEFFIRYEVLKSLTSKQRKQIYNLAQQSIANTRNSILSDEYTLNTTLYDKTVPFLVNFILSFNPTITAASHNVNSIETPLSTILTTVLSVKDSITETFENITYLLSQLNITTRTPLTEATYLLQILPRLQIQLGEVGSPTLKYEEINTLKLTSLVELLLQGGITDEASIITILPSIQVQLGEVGTPILKYEETSTLGLTSLIGLLLQGGITDETNIVMVSPSIEVQLGEVGTPMLKYEDTNTLLLSSSMGYEIQGEDSHIIDLISSINLTLYTIYESNNNIELNSVVVVVAYQIVPDTNIIELKPTVALTI